MEVQGVNNNIYNQTAIAEKQKVAAAVGNPAQEANTASDVENEGAEYIKTEEAETTKGATYDRTATIEYLRQAQEARMASFRNMIMQLLGQQGDKYNITMPEMEFQISDADVEAAKAAIAEGGEWSVEAVAGRIMDMAYALAGGDTSKIGILKDAVLKGFEDAERAWGGEMPEITGKTYDAVMKAFDEWEAEAAGKTEANQAENNAETEAAGATDLSKE